jgi:hypothetical protein
MLHEEKILDRVKEITGAESARVERKAESFWTVLLSFPDGPDAYTFQTRMVDISSGEPRMIGFNF